MEKLFSQEMMEQCLFYTYRCVQPLGQDSIWKQEKQKGKFPVHLIGKALAYSVYCLCGVAA